MMLPRNSSFLHNGQNACPPHSSLQWLQQSRHTLWQHPSVWDSFPSSPHIGSKQIGHSSCCANSSNLALIIARLRPISAEFCPALRHMSYTNHRCTTNSTPIL